MVYKYLTSNYTKNHIKQKLILAKNNTLYLLQDRN